MLLAIFAASLMLDWECEGEHVNSSAVDGALGWTLWHQMVRFPWSAIPHRCPGGAGYHCCITLDGSLGVGVTESCPPSLFFFLTFNQLLQQWDFMAIFHWEHFFRLATSGKKTLHSKTRNPSDSFETIYWTFETRSQLNTELSLHPQTKTGFTSLNSDRRECYRTL